MRIIKRSGMTPIRARGRLKRALSIGLLAVPLLVGAEGRGGPHITAPLDSVTRTGFYRIVLYPQVVAYCRPDLADLRIVSKKGAIPYALNEDRNGPWNAGYLALPDVSVRQNDSSNKHSYIRLEYDNDYRVDRLLLVVKGPTLYKRNVQVYDGGEFIARYSIDPHDSVLQLPSPVRTRRLLIDIENADNAPLVIARLAGYQSGIYLLVRLEAGGSYQLEGGDSQAQRPEYDLHYFTDSLKTRPMDIGYTAVRRWPAPAGGAGDTLQGAAPVVAGAGADHPEHSILLWSVLALVLLFLLYFSVKMVKAIGKKENNDSV